MIKNRMRELRARYQMSQEELAKKVGVRRETIGNLEKGRYNPSLVLAWNIAKVFDVTIEEVFTVEPEEEKKSENKKAT
jgi:putative transcriptional regulator